MHQKIKTKRLLIIALITSVIASAVLLGLFILDRTRGNKYYEHPNIASQEYFKQYPPDDSGGISLLWTYEHFHGVSAPTLSSDGQHILFITLMNDKLSLVCLNNKGEKVWVIGRRISNATIRAKKKVYLTAGCNHAKEAEMQPDYRFLRIVHPSTRLEYQGGRSLRCS